jgi:biotin carboxyl carrier protein
MLTVEWESEQASGQRAVGWTRNAGGARMTMDGMEHGLRLLAAGGGRLELAIDGRACVAYVAQHGELAYVRAGGRCWTVRVHDPVRDAGARGSEGDVYAAPMPGTVVAVRVAAGDSVAAGQVLAVIESMKMQVSIEARRDGVVAEVCRSPGETFERDAPLVRLAAREA